MTALRLFSIVSLGILVGTIVWAALTGLLFILMAFGGGFPPGPQPSQIGDYLKTGLIIGAVHGAVVAAGTVAAAHKDSLFQSVLTGFVFSELGLVLALACAYFAGAAGFKITTLADSIQAAVLYFLFFSAITLGPTIVIGILVSRFSNFVPSS